MDARLQQWKLLVDRLWSASSPDYAQAARLAAEIARSDEPRLAAAAAQAVPSLRNAAGRGADAGVKALGRRRLGAVRDALHTLAAPRFGRRQGMASPQEHYRRMLGLPLDRRLHGSEIKEAYKRAAKRVHPDAGGTEADFRALAEAREHLMRLLER